MKRYLAERVLRGMIAKYIDIVNYNDSSHFNRVNEEYMCHVERYVSGRGQYYFNENFSNLLERHGVSRNGSLDYVGADEVRRTPNQRVRNKNALRLTFLLLLLESGLH